MVCGVQQADAVKGLCSMLDEQIKDLETLVERKEDELRAVLDG